MFITYEKESDYFLEVNNCGVQMLSQVNTTRHRINGRVDYHILYISHGACYIKQNNAEIKVEQGNIVLFKPKEEQYYRFYIEDKTVSCYVHFSGTLCEDLLRELELDNRVTYVGVSNTLSKLFAQMRDEYVANKPYKKQVCASIFMQFLTQAARNAKYFSNGIDIKLTKRMQDIRTLMDRTFAENFSVEYYADKCSLSVDRFSHVFKESVGISPKQYLQKLKVDTACRLLQNIDLSVNDVAVAVGVNDTNYFSKLIKRYTGNTPSYFRK